MLFASIDNVNIGLRPVQYLGRTGWHAKKEKVRIGKPGTIL